MSRCLLFFIIGVYIEHLNKLRKTLKTAMTDTNKRHTLRLILTEDLASRLDAQRPLFRTRSAAAYHALLKGLEALE